MKNKILIIMAVLILGLSSVSAAEIVTDLYHGEHVFDLTQTATPEIGTYDPVDIKSCHTQANYESGSCNYLYACYAVLPDYSLSVDHALRRECVDVTNQTSYYMTFDFSPPKGLKAAVTYFLTQVDYTYDSTLGQEKWNYTPSIVYTTGVDIISLCPDGEMLRGNICYLAQPFCYDTMSNNMCDNPNQLYMLDTGNGFVETAYHDMCADRRPTDYICDTVISFDCYDGFINRVSDCPRFRRGCKMGWRERR